MGCPVCQSNQIGKIGSNQFYCWNCFVEFNEKNQIFSVAEDGSLVAFGPDTLETPVS